jgi:hypothetical protein
MSLADVRSTDHHTRYTDTDAISAVNENLTIYLHISQAQEESLYYRYAVSQANVITIYCFDESKVSKLEEIVENLRNPFVLARGYVFTSETERLSDSPDITQVVQP